MKKIINAGFNITSIRAKATNEVTILFSVIKRKDLESFLAIINESDKNFLFGGESAREAHLGIYPPRETAVSPANGRDILRKITNGFSKRK